MTPMDAVDDANPDDDVGAASFKLDGEEDEDDAAAVVSAVTEGVATDIVGVSGGSGTSLLPPF